MTNEKKTSGAERPSRPHLSAKDLEALGLTPGGLDAAIGRAKLEAQRKQRAHRPKLDTNPELDEWFD